jgi:RNA polymerase sigma-70 factor, ECF subfamily
MADAPSVAADTFERHRLEVYRWAARALSRHTDALDVTQDVALRWLLQCRRVVPANPRAWLRRSTLNRAMDCLRARQMDRQVRQAHAPRSAAVLPDDPLEQQDLQRYVSQALAILSDMQREVLIAKLWDAMTFEQIANELDIATPTAKTHYVRALAAIRGQIGSRFPNP